MLEELEHARARGAPILAEFLGGSFTCDAHHMTEPQPQGAGVKLCIERWAACLILMYSDITCEAQVCLHKQLLPLTSNVLIAFLLKEASEVGWPASRSGLLTPHLPALDGMPSWAPPPSFVDVCVVCGDRGSFDM